MRSRRTEVILAVFLLAVCNAALVYAAGARWNCQGNHNCASTTCINPPDYSCGEITPVNHPKCEYTGNRAHSCDITQRACLKVEYYAGGTCHGTPPSCAGLFPWNISAYLCEDGCGTETHTCSDSI